MPHCGVEEDASNSDILDRSGSPVIFFPTFDRSECEHLWGDRHYKYRPSSDFWKSKMSILCFLVSLAVGLAARGSVPYRHSGKVSYG